ncbi:hypothetical protein ACOMHN_030968 [Nucella lapillus]
MPKSAPQVQISNHKLLICHDINLIRGSYKSPLPTHTHFIFLPPARPTRNSNRCHAQWDSSPDSWFLIGLLLIRLLVGPVASRVITNILAVHLASCSTVFPLPPFSWKKMSSRLVCLVLAVCLCLAASHTKGTARRSAINRLVGQQPLLFGRRGINPNMNSLFFGKRNGAGGPFSLEGLKTACTVLISAYEQISLAEDNES